MVNWQKEAIDDLRRYPALRQSLDSIRERRAALDLQAGAERNSGAGRQWWQCYE